MNPNAWIDLLLVTALTAICSPKQASTTSTGDSSTWSSECIRPSTIASAFSFWSAMDSSREPYRARSRRRISAWTPSPEPRNLGTDPDPRTAFRDLATANTCFESCGCLTRPEVCGSLGGYFSPLPCAVHLPFNQFIQTPSTTRNLRLRPSAPTARDR